MDVWTLQESCLGAFVQQVVLPSPKLQAKEMDGCTFLLSNHTISEKQKDELLEVAPTKPAQNIILIHFFPREIVAQFFPHELKSFMISPTQALSSYSFPPIESFPHIHQDKNLSKNLLCPICYNPTGHPALLNPCSHTSCSECIAQWLPHSPTCPLCRSKIVTVRLSFPDGTQPPSDFPAGNLEPDSVLQGVWWYVVAEEKESVGDEPSDQWYVVPEEEESVEEGQNHEQCCKSCRQHSHPSNEPLVFCDLCDHAYHVSCGGLDRLPSPNHGFYCPNCDITPLLEVFARDPDRTHDCLQPISQTEKTLSLPSLVSEGKQLRTIYDRPLLFVFSSKQNVTKSFVLILEEMVVFRLVGEHIQRLDRTNLRVAKKRNLANNSSSSNNSVDANYHVGCTKVLIPNNLVLEAFPFLYPSTHASHKTMRVYQMSFENFSHYLNAGCQITLDCEAIYFYQDQ